MLDRSGHPGRSSRSASEERIGSLFLSHRCRWPVSRQHAGRIGKREYFRTNAGQQELGIPSRQIGSTNASGEENISAKQEAVVLSVKAKTSRAMTGHKQHLEIYSGEVDGGCLGYEKVSGDRLNLEKEAEILKEIWIGDKRNTGLVITDFAVERMFDFRRIINVIQVAVGNQEKAGFKTVFPEPLAYSGRRVDQNLASRRMEQIAVRVEDPANKCLKLEHTEERVPPQASNFFLA